MIDCVIDYEIYRLSGNVTSLNDQINLTKSGDSYEYCEVCGVIEFISRSICIIISNVKKFKKSKAFFLISSRICETYKRYKVENETKQAYKLNLPLKDH